MTLSLEQTSSLRKNTRELFASGPRSEPIETATRNHITDVTGIAEVTQNKACTILKNATSSRATPRAVLNRANIRPQRVVNSTVVHTESVVCKWVLHISEIQAEPILTKCFLSLVVQLVLQFHVLPICAEQTFHGSNSALREHQKQRILRVNGTWVFFWTFFFFQTFLCVCSA